MIPLFQDNNFLKLISNNLPDMLWAKDLDGNYLFANKMTLDNLLMVEDTQEYIGKNDDFFATREKAKHPNNPQWHTFGELCQDSDNTVLKEKKPFRFEECGNIRGELIYLDVHKAPFYDEDKNLIGVIGSARDITKHKKIERELEINNHLIESGPVVVFEWSGADGWPIIFVSSNVEKVLGINYKKLQDSAVNFSDFIHPDDISYVLKEFNEYVASQTTSFSQEYRLLRDDSSVVWIKDFTVIEYNKDKTPHIIKGYVFDNTIEKQAREKIEHLNYYDQLTLLPNRQKIMIDIKKNPPYACAIFNIESFRELNDFFGITVGDSILFQLAQKSIEMGITAYRIGGDEFAVLFYEDISHYAMQEHISNMLLHLDEIDLNIAEERVNISMNVGIAFKSDRILTHADIALHMAKEKRVPFAIYEEDEKVEEIYRKNIAMTATIHKALQENRIICYYQPIVNFNTQKIEKYETLVRIIDEDGTIIMPNDFLPIAKKTKLYSRITQELVSQACKCFSSRDEIFSINLSIEDISNQEVVQEIINTIVQTDTASRVVFELLESEGIDDYDLVSKFIAQVKALGARIAIDDFGTGYSNFEHILKLNVDCIKIDGSLVKEIATNDRHKIIVETIVDFAKKIGACTIAEYVCDKEVYDSIKKTGVDFSQGYYTGKPQPLE
jgi:diguanylate cyclase (GGDEF)-like protein